MSEPERWTWPVSQLPDVIEALARASGLRLPTVEVPSPPPSDVEKSLAVLAEWLELAASAVGLEVEAVATTYGQVPAMIRSAGPAIMVLPGSPKRVVGLVGRGAKRIPVVGPDRRVHLIEVDDLVVRMYAPHDAQVEAFVSTVLDRAAVPAARRARARQALLVERLGAVEVDGLFILRPSPSGSIVDHATRIGLPRRILTLVGANTAQQLLVMASFVAVGGGALSGHIDPGWLMAWSLLLVSMIPLRVFATVTAMLFAIDTSALVKQRLLVGALAMNASDMRKMGAGRLLGQVLDAEAIEGLMLGGGVQSLAAIVDLVFALGILAVSGLGPLPVTMLVVWLGITIGMLVRHWRHRRNWTKTRLEMTYGFIDQLVGHRTRVAQEPAETFHEGEDRTLERYLHDSLALDQAEIGATIFLRRGYLVVGMASLAPGLLSGATAVSIAVAVGGMLMAARGLVAIAGGAVQLTAAAIAWANIAPLYRAAGRTPAPNTTLLAVLNDNAKEGPIIDARQLSLRYPGRTRPVFTGANVQIVDGDRVLLEGPSGSGKSTLGALVAGLLEPSDGLLLVRGLDRHTIGLAGFRRHVASAPQFQENHVFTAPFAWNLLMGRAWPARPEDVKEAEDICRELGLSGLLERMPAGMMQMVGETGWQLSHGEKSRLYIARALLQKTDLIVLDESFAALDPETLERALKCVLSRANAVVVIAHP